MSKKGKTHKAIAKRFRVTPTGKVLHRGSGRNHNTNKQPRDRMRQKSIPSQVVGLLARKIKRNLGM
ncbi:50S ribosomal protein L35 [bacterium]|nr:50S ribosomal protein L35 [bacterium]